MPLSEQIAFSRPLKEAVLARHRPGEGEREHPGDQSSEEENPYTISEDYLKSETERAYREGFAAGKVEGEDASKAAMDVLRSKISTVLEGIQSESDNLVRELESILPEFILEGVGRILQTTEPDAEAVSATVNDLLKGVDTEDQVIRLSINPKDADLLAEFDPSLGERFPRLTLVRDSGLSRGECFLESRFGIADARFAAKLDNLRKVLK